jgi:hypothetical protein
MSEPNIDTGPSDKHENDDILDYSVNIIQPLFFFSDPFGIVVVHTNILRKCVHKRRFGRLHWPFATRTTI